MDLDERGLLEAVQNGEPAALQEFVERHKKQVYFLSLSLTGNQHDAEDLSQEVFMKAFISIKGFRGDSKLNSWLHRITVNAYLDQKARRSFRLIRMSEPIDKELGPELQSSDSSTDPEKQYERRTLRIAIEKAMEKLSPRQRSVFVLRHYGELPLKEIAETLKVKEGTVKSALFIAVRRLQKHLEKYHTQENLS